MLAILAILLVSVQGRSRTLHPHSTNPVHHTTPQPSETMSGTDWAALAEVCPAWASYGMAVCQDGPDACTRLPNENELISMCQDAEVGTACYGAATNEIPDLTNQILNLCPTHAPTDAATQTPEATSTVEETTQLAEQTTEAPVDQTTEAPVDQTTEAPVDETTEAPVDQTTEAPVLETPVPVSTEKAPIPNDVQIEVAVEIELPEDEAEQEAIGDAFASSVESIVQQEYPDVTVLFNGWIEVPSTTSSRRLLAAKEWKADLIFRSPPAPVSEDSGSSSGSGSANVPVGPVAPSLTGAALAKAAADNVAEKLADPNSGISEQIKTKTVQNLQENPNFDASKVASISNSLSVPEQTVEPKVVPEPEEEESSSYKAAALIIGLVVAVSVVGSISYIHFRNKRNEKRARGQLLEDGQAVALTQV